MNKPNCAKETQQMKEAEQRLAETQARQVILMNCPPVIFEEEMYYNIFWKEAEIQWEVKYLRMRGVLMHHPKRPNLVQFKQS